MILSRMRIEKGSLVTDAAKPGHILALNESRDVLQLFNDLLEKGSSGLPPSRIRPKTSVRS